ncbi:MAG: DUF4382 domain-containing protein [Planctomycetota bacterium]
MRTAQLTLGAALATLPLVAACSSSDDDAPTPATITMALTDAASDDLTSFCVDVTAIRLTRQGGETVGVLPDPIRVDLLNLTDVSQILNIVSVPAGLFRMAEITFDFTTAEAWLVGEATAASIVDGDGNALTGAVTLPITVAGSFAALANRNTVLELDFDLDHSVRTDTSTNQVFVEPAVVLRVNRNDPKEIVVLGDVTFVNGTSNLINVEMQTLAGERITDVTVGVSQTTVYQINGTPYTGDAGLLALSALGRGAWIQLYGAVNPLLSRIDSNYVEAGTGTYNGGSDIVQGHVIQRVGAAGADATLMVLGHSDDSTHTNFQFNTVFTINTEFANTAVTYRGTALTRDTDDINIGQRVRIFGDLTGTTLDATGTANGVVRMQPTRLRGFANAAPTAGVFATDVSLVGLRDQSVFTWTDGGPTPPNPDALTISSGALADGLGIDTNTPVEVRGFFPAVDDAAEDFVAVSVENLDNAPSLLVVVDRANGMTVTPAIDTTLQLAFGGTALATEAALVDSGFIGQTAIPTTPPLTVEGTPGFGIYLVSNRQTNAVSLHLGFPDFLNALSTGIGLGGDIYNLIGLGTYSGVVTNTVTAGLMIVVLD